MIQVLQVLTITSIILHQEPGEEGVELVMVQELVVVVAETLLVLVVAVVVVQARLSILTILYS